MSGTSVIQVVRRNRPTPPERTPPRGARWHARTTANGRRVFIHIRVIEAIREMNARHTPDEVAGLLTGGLFSHGGDEYAVVNNLVTHLPGEIESSPTHVRITARGSDDMSIRAEHQDFLCTVLGWWHTHPTFKAYFSAVDRDEQRHWQQAMSVGLVLSGSPGSGPEWLVFVGPESEETSNAPEPTAAMTDPGVGVVGRIRTTARTKRTANAPRGMPPTRRRHPLSTPHRTHQPVHAGPGRTRVFGSWTSSCNGATARPDVAPYDSVRRPSRAESWLDSRRIRAVVALCLVLVAIVAMVAFRTLSRDHRSVHRVTTGGGVTMPLTVPSSVRSPAPSTANGRIMAMPYRLEP